MKKVVLLVVAMMFAFTMTVAAAERAAASGWINHAHAFSLKNFSIALASAHD